MAEIYSPIKPGLLRDVLDTSLKIGKSALTILGLFTALYGGQHNTDGRDFHPLQECIEMIKDIWKKGED